MRTTPLQSVRDPQCDCTERCWEVLEGGRCWEVRKRCRVVRVRGGAGWCGGGEFVPPSTFPHLPAPCALTLVSVRDLDADRRHRVHGRGTPARPCVPRR